MLSSLLHAPPLSFLSGSPSRLLSKHNAARASMAATSTRIAVVGDVYDQWNLEEDTKALQFLQMILVKRTLNLFGVLQIVNRLKQLFWETMMPGIQKSSQENTHCHQIRSVTLNMMILIVWKKRRRSTSARMSWRGACSLLMFGLSDFPMVKLSIVGGQPFSNGRKQLFRLNLLSARYGVQDMDGSAKRSAPEDHMVIILASNGPTGLGSNLDDICGKYWVSGGGDHGDADLAQALSLIKETGKFCVPLVVFGRMHKKLADGNGLRQMIVVGVDKTIYLNGAIVPRVKRLNDE